MSGEKRQSPRIAPFVAPCRVIAGDQQISAFVTDLSAQGARVACDGDVPPLAGAVVLEVKLGRKTLQPHRLPGRVAWEGTDKGGRVFGVTFDGLSADEQAAVEAVVEEFQRLASQLS